MELGKGIWALERHFVLHFDIPRAELDDAAKLGMEALKAILEWRKSHNYNLLFNLPGETED